MVEQSVIVERWENALRVLQQMTTHERRRHFNMGSWGQKTECGTIACLAGHCSIDPWFKHRGFTSAFEKITKNHPPQLCFTGQEPEIFFGHGGYNAIFLNCCATFTEVVRDVKKHIKWLKCGGDPQVFPGWAQ